MMPSRDAFKVIRRKTYHVPAAATPVMRLCFYVSMAWQYCVKINFWKIIYCFVEKHHLTSTWKDMFKDVTSTLPIQGDLDEVLSCAMRLVRKANYLYI